MIVRGDNSMIKQIKEIWRLCFVNEDPRYHDFFFKKLFKPDTALVKIADRQAVSCLMRIPHDVMLNGVVIRASMIMGVATVPKYQNRGFMHELMNVALDEAEHQELVTFIQAYNPSIYEQFGFRMVYYKRVYEITRDNVDKISNDGCAFNPKVNDMFKAYSMFVKRFNGFYIRNFERFGQYMEEVRAQGGKIVAYYDQYGLIQGYAVLLLEGLNVVIEELVYLNSVALLKLLNIALQQRATAIVHVSGAEDLSILLKGAVGKKYGFTMARINDYELFNRLYGSDVSSVEEAFKISNKPLYMNEFM